MKIISVLCIVIALIASCKKIDLQKQRQQLPEENTQSKSEIEHQFFYEHAPTDKMVMAIRDKILRQQQAKPFVEKFVKYAGYPAWDKALRAAGQSPANNKKDDASTVILIPFVLENAKSVTSVLRVL